MLDVEIGGRSERVERRTKTILSIEAEGLDCGG